MVPATPRGLFGPSFLAMIMFEKFGTLFRPDRSPGPLTRALCWAHARRKFFELADVAG